MENKWILIPLLVIIEIGIFYFVYKEEDKTTPREFFHKIIDVFLEFVATFFFGLFGFSWEQFNQKTEGNNSSAKN